MIDDLSSLLSTTARPGKVSSPEGTAPSARFNPQVNPDHGKPMPPDVDGLFGAKQSYLLIKSEKAEHRLVLWHRLNGMSQKEVAQVMGYTPAWVSQICNQPWFQHAFNSLAEEMGKSRVEAFLDGEILPALERTVKLATHGESEAVRLAANREILDRYLGKSTVKVESKSSVDVTNTTINAADLLREQARLDEQLKGRGLLYGNS